MNVKKIFAIGGGYAVYVTKEAKLFGWNQQNSVIITAVKDEDGEAIVIRKAPVKTRSKR